MYARVTQLEIDTMRATVPGAIALFEREVLPELQAQNGYRGVYVLVAPEGQATLVSFWATEEQAQVSEGSGFYAETLARYATLFAASLVTGDTMSRTIRSSVLRALGDTDETVVAAGAELDPTLQLDAVAAVADQDAVETVRDALGKSPLVDGVAPAVIEPIAVQDRTSRRSEPRVTLFGSDPGSLAGFGE